MMMNNLRVEKYTWLAAPLGDENPQATFRASNADIQAALAGKFPDTTPIMLHNFFLAAKEVAPFPPKRHRKTCGR